MNKNQLHIGKVAIGLWIWVLVVVLTAPFDPAVYAGTTIVDDLKVEGDAVFQGGIEFQEITGSVPTGMVLHYTMTTNQSPYLADDSGSGNTGPVSGATWTSSGKNGGGYEFSGTNAQITTGTGAFDGLTEGSVSLWFYLDTKDRWHGLVGYDADGLERWYLAISGGNRIVIYLEAGDVKIFYITQTTSTLTNGQWYHIAFTTSSADGNQVYLNGAAETATYDTGSAATNLFFDQLAGHSCVYRLGAARGGGGLLYLDGKMDEVLLYDRALTSNEVESLYNSYHVPSADEGKITAKSITVTNGINQEVSTATNYLIGKLGIGTNSPSEQLHVNGKLKMEDNIILNDNWLSGDGDDEGVYVASDGKVGIGTNAPGVPLEVNGYIRSYAAIVNGGYHMMYPQDAGYEYFKWWNYKGTLRLFREGDPSFMLLIRGTNSSSATLHLKGTARFDNGITYIPQLGDLSMGSFTNSP